MERKRFLKIFESKIHYEELKNEIMDIPHTVLFDDSNEIFIQKTPFEKKYFTIESLEKGTFTISLPQSFKYKFNNEEWVETSETVAIDMEIGDTIQISHVADVVQQSIIGKSCKFNVYGNIMSLLYGDNFEGQTELSENNFIFYSLFQNCRTLQSAENLILPAMTLKSFCYAYMFDGCTSLTVVPELPAMELADRCYYSMFNGCTSLTEAPVLPATELAQRCYWNMFSNCTSLTSAQELLSTTLAEGCYAYMFDGCTSLTVVPELPATTLEQNCYISMFQGCTSLTTAPQLLATTVAELSCKWMFSGCTSLTTAPQLLSTTLANNCYCAMFNGCESLTEAPELPATTLEQNCYIDMFNGCTNLVKAPELPATTLANGCYMRMFSGCSNLNYIKMLATDIRADFCLDYWVVGVAAEGTFVKSAAMTSLSSGTSGIPSGWTVENTVELLNGYEYVNLGLPSGTLWAKCDYGANSETDDGLYFSRLNSVNGLPSSQIPDDIPPTPNQGEDIVKFNNSVVESQEDAIPKLMGDGWSMPKNSDIEELIENTNQEMTEINGVKGTKFFNRNDNTLYIFFPYSEYNYGTYVCWLNDVYTHGDNTTSPSRFMTMFDAQKSNYHFTHIGYQTFGAKANRYRGIIRKK